MVTPAINVSFLPLFIFSRFPLSPANSEHFRTLTAGFFFWHWHYVIHSHFAIWYHFTCTVYGVSLYSNTASVQISIAQVAHGWRAWCLIYKSIAQCVTKNFEKYCGIISYMESITVFCEQFHAQFSQCFFFFCKKVKCFEENSPAMAWRVLTEKCGKPAERNKLSDLCHRENPYLVLP